MAMATSAKRARSESTVSLESIMSDMDSVSYTKSGRDLSRNQMSPTDLFFQNKVEFGREVNAHERSSPAPPSKRQRKCAQTYEEVKESSIRSFRNPFVPDYGEIMRTARLSGTVLPHETSHMIALFASLYETKGCGQARSFVETIVSNIYEGYSAQKRNTKAALCALYSLKRTEQSSLVRPIALDHYEVQERIRTQNQAVAFRELCFCHFTLTLQSPAAS